MPVDDSLLWARTNFRTLKNKQWSRNITPRDGDQGAFLFCIALYPQSVTHHLGTILTDLSSWLKIILFQKPKPFDGEEDKTQIVLNGGDFMTLFITTLTPKRKWLTFMKANHEAITLYLSWSEDCHYLYVMRPSVTLQQHQSK